MLGMSMTYTLFEWAKENMETLLENQPGEKFRMQGSHRVLYTEPWFYIQNHGSIYRTRPILFCNIYMCN